MVAERGKWPETGFGERLKALREERGLSQNELAAKAGVHRFTVSKLERGTQEPAWPVVLAFCNAMGCEPNDFLPRLTGAHRMPQDGRGRAKESKVARGTGRSERAV
jgi:transcriptional regulator with XRE-family HTH domain